MRCETQSTTVRGIRRSANLEIGNRQANNAHNHAAPTNRWAGCELLTTPRGMGCVTIQAAPAAPATIDPPNHSAGESRSKRPSRCANPAIKNTLYSARSPNCHTSSGAPPIVNRGFRPSASSANTSTRGGTNTQIRARRCAARRSGLRSSSQNMARTYHSGCDIQPPCHAEPWGSPRGTIQKMMLRQGTAVRGDGSASHAIRMATNAPAPKTHSGRSTRRALSARTFGHGRRSRDLASREPVTKNIAGTAATR